MRQTVSWTRFYLRCDPLGCFTPDAPQALCPCTSEWMLRRCRGNAHPLIQGRNGWGVPRVKQAKNFPSLTLDLQTSLSSEKFTSGCDFPSEKDPLNHTPEFQLSSSSVFRTFSYQNCRLIPLLCRKLLPVKDKRSECLSSQSENALFTHTSLFSQLVVQHKNPWSIQTLLQLDLHKQQLVLNEWLLCW